MESSSSSSPETPRRLEYVGFWKRFVAFLIDSSVVLVVLTPLMYAIHRASDWEQLSASIEKILEQSTRGEQVNISIAVTTSGFAGPVDFLVQVVLPIAALLAFWKFRSATPGKMAISARIVDAKSSGMPTNLQLLLRFIGYFVSMIPFGLGFLWIGIDRKKQGFHDKLAGTVVVYDD